nr:MAG TPA: hypothetical protein [Caudoviricetes sp.]
MAYIGRVISPDSRRGVYGVPCRHHTHGVSAGNL